MCFPNSEMAEGNTMHIEQYGFLVHFVGCPLLPKQSFSGKLSTFYCAVRHTCTFVKINHAGNFLYIIPIYAHI